MYEAGPSGFGLGLVPSEHTSDIKRRQGAITKAGPSHARRLLVESAHHYRTRHTSDRLCSAAKPAKTQSRRGRLAGTV